MRRIAGKRYQFTDVPFNYVKNDETLWPIKSAEYRYYYNSPSGQWSRITLPYIFVY